MNDAEFQALIDKLNNIEYTVKNATSNTKILYSIESGEVIALYNNPHTHGLYINNRKAQLSQQQETQMISLIQDLVDGYSVEIEQAEEENDFELNRSIQNILNG